MNDIKEKSAPETVISETETKNYDTAIINQAVEKINPKLKKLNKYAAVIAEPTAKALHGFCRQSEEFARAIAETDKTFKDCLETITKDIGSSISDIEVYQKAVEFFFPGAKVEFRMLIHMSEYEILCRWICRPSRTGQHEHLFYQAEISGTYSILHH